MLNAKCLMFNEGARARAGGVFFFHADRADYLDCFCENEAYLKSAKSARTLYMPTHFTHTLIKN